MKIILPIPLPLTKCHDQSLYRKRVEQQYGVRESPYADSITYPFTKSEFQKAESDNINSYDYDTILKPRDISHITDLQLDNILNFKTWSKGTRLKLRFLLVKQMTFCLVLKHFYPSTIESRMKLLISTKEPTSYWSYRSTTRRNMTKSIAICNILSNWIL